jgi:hypothetical protein
LQLFHSDTTCVVAKVRPNVGDMHKPVRTAVGKVLETMRGAMTQEEQAALIGARRADDISAVSHGHRRLGIKRALLWAKRGGVWRFALIDAQLEDTYQTSVRVGVTSWAASMSEDEWIAFRREALRKAG